MEREGAEIADLEAPMQTEHSSRHSDVAGDNVGSQSAGVLRRKRFQFWTHRRILQKLLAAKRNCGKEEELSS